MTEDCCTALIKGNIDVGGVLVIVKSMPLMMSRVAKAMLSGNMPGKHKDSNGGSSSTTVDVVDGAVH
eukprot:839797-Ditylum_brightwellii.AAC.1